jgi:hypothetical protein
MAGKSITFLFLPTMNYLSKILFLFAIITITGNLGFSQSFDFNQNCKKAYQKIFNLELDEGERLLENEKVTNPDNHAIYLLSDYIDFFRIYIREDEDLYFELLPNKKNRLKQISSGDKSSPYYLYAQAEILIHWSIVRLKFEEYLGAFSNVKKAWQLLQKNKRKFPSFIGNNKSMGVLHAIVGAIPNEYKWGVELLGFEGDIDKGIGELEELLANSDEESYIFRPEAEVLLAFLELHIARNKDKAWQIANDENFLTKDGLLKYFVKASIAMHTGKNDIAVNLLLHRPKGDQYEPFYFLDYLTGLVKLRRLDGDADQYIDLFLHRFNGKNYIKEAWQKLAWHALLNGDMDLYNVRIRRSKSEGYALIEPDKAALAEAKNGIIPNQILLKARLLFDGGYYYRALGLLQGFSINDFNSLHDQLEFTYRAGRLFMALSDFEQARGYFYATIKNDRESHFYFPSAACLQLGLIFEKEMDVERARFYFKRCLSYKGNPYQSGLESQAKAGMQRLKKKSNNRNY